MERDPVPPSSLSLCAARHRPDRPSPFPKPVPSASRRSTGRRRSCPPGWGWGACGTPQRRCCRTTQGASSQTVGLRGRRTKSIRIEPGPLEAEGHILARRLSCRAPTGVRRTRTTRGSRLPIAESAECLWNGRPRFTWRLPGRPRTVRVLDDERSTLFAVLGALVVVLRLEQRLSGVVESPDPEPDSRPALMRPGSLRRHQASLKRWCAVSVDGELHAVVLEREGPGHRPGPAVVGVVPEASQSLVFTAYAVAARATRVA